MHFAAMYTTKAWVANGVFVLLFAFHSSPAYATLVTFGSKEAFAAAVDNVSYESFEGQAAVLIPANGSLDVGAFALSSTSPVSILDATFMEQHATDGSKFAAFAGTELRFHFHSPITAFAVTVVDFGDGAANRLSLSTSAGDSLLIRETTRASEFASGSEFFFGISSTLPISSLVFHSSANPAEGIAFDGVFYSVPEPSSVPISILGFLFLFGARWQRLLRTEDSRFPCGGERCASGQAKRIIWKIALMMTYALPLTSSQAAGTIIDFESLPNGAQPADDVQLSSPYTIEGGGTVQFFFDANLNGAYEPMVDVLPVFEAIGNSGTDGFVASQVSGNDRPRSGFEGQLGTFFLRQPEGSGRVPAPFVIAYDTDQTIREFSGEIWDIDGAVSGTEQWQIDALNGAGNILATLRSPLGVNANSSSLDSLPWNFAFLDLPSGLQSVRLTFVGSKSDGIGLAFNNFSAVKAIPEPGVGWLIVLTALAMWGSILRRRERSGANCARLK